MGSHIRLGQTILYKGTHYYENEIKEGPARDANR